LIPAYTYHEIVNDLTYASRWKGRVRLVGLLFTQPTSPLGQSEIVPQLEYFHHRSGNSVHFFCAGFGAYWPDEEFPDRREVARIDGTTWYFSARKFNQLRQELVAKTQWKYGGGTELLLLNTSRVNEQIGLNLSYCPAFQLEEMQHDGVIISVASFFETIFDFSEEYRGRDPLSKFLNPPTALIPGTAPHNLGILYDRMNAAWKRHDYGEVVHASASILETMAKHVVAQPNIRDQTLAGFFDLYRKHSKLSKRQLDRVLQIYQQGNTIPLAGHGSVNEPGISMDEAEQIVQITNECVRTEYKHRVRYVGA